MEKVPKQTADLQVSLLEYRGEQQFTGDLTTLEDLADRIRGDERLEKLTSRLRSMPRGEDYDRGKRGLPAMIPAVAAPEGTAIKGMSATWHNGLYGYDIDEDRANLDIPALRAALTLAPGCVMVGLSAGGDALFTIFAGPVATSVSGYKANWQAIADRMPTSARAASSAQSKNLNRLRSMAHDPALWLAESVIPLDLEPPPSPAKRSTPEHPVDEKDTDASALGWIQPPDDYNAWLGWVTTLKAVGFAVEAVESWSAQGSRYREGEVSDRWKGLPDDALNDARNKLRGHAYNLGWRDAVNHPPYPGTNQGATPPQSTTWWVEGDFVGKWECTPDADCARVMRRFASDLLVVEPTDGGRAYLRAQSAGGIWGNRDSHIDGLLAKTGREWASDAIYTEVSGGVATSVVRWQKQTATRKGRDAAQDSVGAVKHNWHSMGIMPPDLTECHERDLDADRRYMGAQNGVIDLDTGTLLTGEAARQKLITRSIPDAYNPDARHPAVDSLLAHLGQAEREYLLDAFGYHLRFGPRRRLYLLVGPRKGGKSTLLQAVVAALGDVRSGGYGMAIPGDALLNSRGAINPNGHQGNIYGIQYARIAIASEVPEGRARFNTGLIKSLDGVAPVPLRDVGEKAGVSRPAAATLFISVNKGDVDRLDMTDSALVDRTRILPYPKLPGQPNPAYVDILREDPKARQAMIALLVGVAKGRHADSLPPADIPSVAHAVEERRESSIGPLGQWFISRVKITGKVRGRDVDFVPADHIWEMAYLALGGKDDKVDGVDRRQAFALLRETVEGLPTQTSQRVEGKPTKGYKGVKLLSQEEATALEESIVCGKCGGKPADFNLSPNGWCDRCEEDSTSAPFGFSIDSIGNIDFAVTVVAAAPAETLAAADRLGDAQRAIDVAMKFPALPARLMRKQMESLMDGVLLCDSCQINGGPGTPQCPACWQFADKAYDWTKRFGLDLEQTAESFDHDADEHGNALADEGGSWLEGV